MQENQIKRSDKPEQLRLSRTEKAVVYQFER